jgi:hypothetical protein
MAIARSDSTGAQSTRLSSYREFGYQSSCLRIEGSVASVDLSSDPKRVRVQVALRFRVLGSGCKSGAYLQPQRMRVVVVSTTTAWSD